MKLELCATNNRSGITIMELLVTTAVMSALTMILFMMYSRGTNTFKITSWKQERTSQAEIFWAGMRKHLEEASNLYDMSLSDAAGSSNPIIPEVIRPLQVHPDPTSVGAGNILAWNSSQLDFQFTAPFAHTSTSQTYFLRKNGRRLVLLMNQGVQNRTIARLDDVVDITFVVESVVKNSNNEEEIVDGFVAGASGTMLTISIILAPPQGYIAEQLRVPQNHKFRLNVAPISDASLG